MNTEDASSRSLAADRRYHGSRRWWALGAVTLAVLTIGLDATVLSVALPTLATALQASESDLQWFTSGYALVLAAAMLPAGLLGDRLGRKKVLLCALAVFALGSAACAYAPSAGVFLAARLLLGVAGAGITVMVLSSLTVLFSDEERPRAVAVWAAANFLALPLGPILGGWLLSNFWWGWVFLINLPVALIGLVATLALVPESRAPVRPALDPVGVLTSSAGLVAITYGVIEAGRSGWGDATAIVWMIAGAAIVSAFLFWERRQARIPAGDPLLDLSLFRSASFTWGAILAALTLLGMTGVLFAMPQYFQGVRGFDAMGSGLCLLPLIGGMVAGVILASRLALVIGAKITGALGFLVAAAAMIIGSTTAVDAGITFVSAWMGLAGLGTGLTLSTVASAALAELPQERSGVGSAAMQALQKLGAPFGAAILGSMLLTTYQANLDLGGLPAATATAVKSSIFSGAAIARQLGSTGLQDSVRAAFTHGLSASLLVAAAISVFGMILTLIFLPGRATADSDEVGLGAKGDGRSLASDKDQGRSSAGR